MITTLLTLGLAGEGRAQALCAQIWSEVPSSRIDKQYVESARRWSEISKTNTLQQLLGRKKGLLPTDLSFRIEQFHQSREYRSWFEFQNRVLPQLGTRQDSAPARVKILPDPSTAFAAKLLAIREAKHTIDVAYYILKNDQAGLSFLHEIKSALKRGVSVRFLVDSTGTLTMAPHSELRALLDFAQREGGFVRDLSGNPTSERATAEVVVFNPITKLPTALVRDLYRRSLALFSGWLGIPRPDPLGYSLNRRSHDKLLIIDGAFQDRAIAFTGGRNMADSYYGLQKDGSPNIVDLEVMVRGTPRPPLSTLAEPRSVGSQFSDYYDQVYFHLGNISLTRTLLGVLRGYDRQYEKMETAHQQTLRELRLNEDPEGVRRSLLELGFEDSKVDVVHTIHNLYRLRADRRLEARDHQSEIKNAQALMAKMENLIKDETQEVVIVSPYLWLSEKQIRLLKSWLLVDPKRRLTFITNSVMTNDNMLAQILVDNVIGPKLVLDPGLFSKDGKRIRRSVADQVRLYQYGRLDAKALGGPKAYGQLHGKGMLLQSSEVAVVGTYNNDPRSLLLNSEGAAVIKNPKVAHELREQIDKMIADSHPWNSPEYHAIREHQNLGAGKRWIARFSNSLYEMIVRLQLWWLI